MLPPQQRTRIKICGLTREEDVDAAVAAGVDALGFVLYAPSPRAVSPRRAAELARRLPPWVTPVLLFVNEAPQRVRTACRLVPGAWVQFHGSETPEECLRACAAGDGDGDRRPFLRVAHIDPDPGAARFDLVEYAARHSEAAAILLDAKVPGHGGSGQTFPWSRLPQRVPAHLVLSGGLTAQNVGGGIGQLRRRGLSLAVDVSSGVEADGVDGHPRKGIKDAGKIRCFVAAVAAADRAAAPTPLSIHDPQSPCPPSRSA